MKATWHSVLLMLLLSEALLLLNFVLIRPNCEPCLPGVPCEPCISNDQRKLVMIMVLLPLGVLLAYFLRQCRTRQRAQAS